MKSDKTWTFSSPIDKVDVRRICREAGPDTKCVRLTVDGKVYTLVNLRNADRIPAPMATCQDAVDVAGNCQDGFKLTSYTYTDRGPSGDVIIGTFTAKTNRATGESKPLRRSQWALYAGDRAGEVMDRVETKVEVF